MMKPAVVVAPSTLAERVRNGDAVAEAELVDLFYRPLRVMVGARITDQQAAFDVTQDVMLAVLQALRKGRLERPDRLSQYVYGTALHLVSDHYRGRKAVPQMNNVPARGVDANPEDYAEHHERLRKVRDAYCALRSVDRKILGLAVVEELTTDEIARRVGMNPDQVRQRKSRAIRRIRNSVTVR